MTGRSVALLVGLGFVVLAWYISRPAPASPFIIITAIVGCVLALALLIYLAGQKR